MNDDAQDLRNYLATRDAACPSCGYNLRGLSVQACPECNQEIGLRVALTEPRIGLFLVGVVGWALGAGFSLLLLVFVLFSSLKYSRSIGPSDYGFLVTLTVGATLQGGAVLLLILHNRRVRRWSLAARVWLALLGYVASLANVLTFAALGF
jgi:hypothetical protein